MTERQRGDRLPKPLVALNANLKQVPQHLLLARLYRFTFEGETYVLTSDRGAVQFIRKLQAQFHFDNLDKEIPTVEVEVMSVQKLTMQNVVHIFKAGLESIILDREIRHLPPFKTMGRYRRYRVGFVKKPRKPKKKKEPAA